MEAKITRGQIGAKNKRELLDYLLRNEYVTVDEIVNNTSISNHNNAHKYIHKLERQHGFKFHREYAVRKLKKGETRFCKIKLKESSKEKARNITLSELALNENRKRLIEKVKQLAACGYCVESIAAKCDETKSVIGHICKHNNIETASKPEDGTLIISMLDRLTIYRPVKKY